VNDANALTGRAGDAVIRQICQRAAFRIVHSAHCTIPSRIWYSYYTIWRHAFECQYAAFYIPISRNLS